MGIWFTLPCKQSFWLYSISLSGWTSRLRENKRRHATVVFLIGESSLSWRTVGEATGSAERGEQKIDFRLGLRILERAKPVVFVDAEGGNASLPGR
jgi:hypothetical protein